MGSDNRKLQKEKIEYWAQSTLIERGWSKGLIKRLLHDPDKLVPNPHYRTAPKMRLFVRSRVLEAEQSEAFVKFKSAASQRVVSARNKQRQQRQNLINQLACPSMCPLAVYEQIVSARWTPFNESSFPEAFCRNMPEQLWLALEPGPEHEQEAVEIVVRIMLAALDAYEGRSRSDTPRFDQVARVFDLWHQQLDVQTSEGAEAFTYVLTEAIAPKGTKGLKLRDRRGYALDRLNEISSRQWYVPTSFFERTLNPRDAWLFCVIGGEAGHTPTGGGERSV